ncbi:armadillo-type protein [Cladochytrium replicatum]|nr:armadillo-type protein [Cladochytrium replicatum]
MAPKHPHSKTKTGAAYGTMTAKATKGGSFYPKFKGAATNKHSLKARAAQNRKQTEQSHGVDKKKPKIVEEVDSEIEEDEEDGLDDMELGSEQEYEDQDNNRGDDAEVDDEGEHGDDDAEDNQEEMAVELKEKTGKSRTESRADQKKLLAERKQLKPHGESIAVAKKLWEKVRVQRLSNSERQPLLEQLMALVKGKAQEIIFKHDASRIIQTCIKYATDEQREEIALELKGRFAELSASQFGKFIVRKVLKYCKKARAGVIEELYGKVKKLIRHRDASTVVEAAYSQFANSQQRHALLEEFYGPEFALLKSGPRTLDSILAAQPHKKSIIMKHLLDNIKSILEKGSFSIGEHSIIHRAILEYLTHDNTESPDGSAATGAGTRELIELLKDHLIHILHTRDGARVTQLCLVHGTAKDRKYFIKTLKSYVVKISKESYGHTTLMCVFETVDDTVLVQKAILAELLGVSSSGTKPDGASSAQVSELMRDQFASRVLLFLICGRSRRYHAPWVLDELEAMDGVRKVTSKKEDALKRKELLGYAGPILVDALVQQPEGISEYARKMGITRLLSDRFASQVIAELALNLEEVLGEPLRDKVDSLLHTIAQAASGTVEALEEQRAADAEQLKKKQAAQPFNAVSKLKAQRDKEKSAALKKRKRSEEDQEKFAVDDDEVDSDDETAPALKGVTATSTSTSATKDDDDSEDLLEHPLLHRQSTTVFRALLAGGRKHTEKEDVSLSAARAHVSDKFAIELINAVTPVQIRYWVERYASDPARTTVSAFLFVAALEYEDVKKVVKPAVKGWGANGSKSIEKLIKDGVQKAKSHAGSSQTSGSGGGNKQVQKKRKVDREESNDLVERERAVEVLWKRLQSL